MTSGRLMSSDQIRQLVASIKADEKFDKDVEQFLLDIADEFVDNVAERACMLAKHRGSNILEVKDVQLHLEKHWNIRVPGFSEGAPPNVLAPPISELHRKRLDIVKRSMAKDDARKRRKADKPVEGNPSSEQQAGD